MNSKMRGFLVLGALASVVGVAQADAAAAVMTAAEEATADVIIFGAYLVTVATLAAPFMIGVKYIKKIVSAA